MSEIQVHREDYSTIKCPVGKEFLAFRKPWEKIDAYCLDCNRTYQFEQYNSMPISSYRGRKVDKLCGCLACELRSEKEGR